MMNIMIKIIFSILIENYKKYYNDGLSSVSFFILIISPSRYLTKSSISFKVNIFLFLTIDIILKKILF